MIDSHCHLNLSVFDTDRNRVIANAFEAGVHGFMNIGFDRDTIEGTKQLLATFPFMLAVAGCHPHDAGSFDESLFEFVADTIDNHDRFVGIGEIGLDFYRDWSPRDKQVEAFGRMLGLAKDKDLPIVIHCRDAFSDVMAMLRDYGASHRGIFHAFAGTPDEVDQILEMGLHIGVGGVVTYKKSGFYDTIKHIPLDRMVLETDSPYLTPHPWRGKRNEPMLVRITAETVARAVGEPLTRVVAATSASFASAMLRGETPPAFAGGHRHDGATYAVLMGSDDEGISAAGPVVVSGTPDPLGEGAAAVVAITGASQVTAVTDGHAGPDVFDYPGLVDTLDRVSVTCYGATAAQHDKVAQTADPESTWAAMMGTLRRARERGLETECRFVAVPKLKPKVCQDLADSIGATARFVNYADPAA